MAIRDRLTIHTKDGRTHQLVVERQGGSIDQEWPKKANETIFRAKMMGKTGEETGEEIAVPVDNISSLIVDKAPKQARKTKG